MKKILLTLFTFVLALNAVAQEEPVLNGNIGSNIQWSYDTKENILTISGKDKINYDDNTIIDLWGKKYTIETESWGIIFTMNFCIKENAQKIIIKEGITQIDQSIFNGFYNVTSVVFPASLTSIGNSAFQNCTNLTSVDLSTSSSLKSIGSSAFKNCTNLTSIEIPESVNEFGTTVFGGCDNLTETCEHIIIKVDPETVGEKYTIKSNIKYIEANAFNGCEKNLRYLFYEGCPKVGGDIANSTVFEKIITTIVPSDMFESFEDNDSYGPRRNETTVKDVSDSRFKSYAFLHDVKIPNGITAYTATTDGVVVTLEPITRGTIKAKEGVFLRAKEGWSGKDFTFTNGEDAQKVNDNQLVGVIENTTLTISDYAYVMQTRDGVQKFYKVEGDFPLARFKAYLKFEGAGAPNMFSIFNFDENTTDIEETEENEDCSANSRTEVYNMAGQKLSAPQKGLNIINGKIVIN